jgi:hypothetical protein
VSWNGLNASTSVRDHEVRVVWSGYRQRQHVLRADVTDRDSEVVGDCGVVAPSLRIRVDWVCDICVVDGESHSNPEFFTRSSHGCCPESICNEKLDCYQTSAIIRSSQPWLRGVQFCSGIWRRSSTVCQPLLGILIIVLHESGTWAIAVVVRLNKKRLDGV